MQRTQVQSLVQEDTTQRTATKLVHHNHGACTLETSSHNYQAWVLQLPKPACALQQEEPPQWDARAPRQRTAPTRRN